MNYPRRLLLVPLALLGDALFMRACLPRPQFEGDKWLWDWAESASYVEVRQWHPNQNKSPELRLELTPAESMEIRDRQSIRTLLRAFKGTGPLKSVMTTREVQHPPAGALIITVGHKVGSIYLMKTDKGFTLTRFPKGESADTDARSVSRALLCLHESIAKARRREGGCYIFEGGCSTAPPR